MRWFMVLSPRPSRLPIRESVIVFFTAPAASGCSLRMEKTQATNEMVGKIRKGANRKAAHDERLFLVFLMALLFLRGSSDKRRCPRWLAG